MQSVLIKLVADKEEAELAQVSLFLSEKISFWNSRRYDRETTLDILWRTTLVFQGTGTQQHRR